MIVAATTGYRLRSALLVIAAVVLVASPAAADGPPSLSSPAMRVDLATLVAEPVAIDPGTPGECSSYHDLALDAGWTEAQWPLLRTIIHRESRCRPSVVNKYGCVGLLQVCTINHARLGVTRADLQDARTNFVVGKRLFDERRWRPWWTRRFRP